MVLTDVENLENLVIYTEFIGNEFKFGVKFLEGNLIESDKILISLEKNIDSLLADSKLIYMGVSLDLSSQLFLNNYMKNLSRNVNRVYSLISNVYVKKENEDFSRECMYIAIDYFETMVCNLKNSILDLDTK